MPVASDSGELLAVLKTALGGTGHWTFFAADPGEMVRLGIFFAAVELFIPAAGATFSRFRWLEELTGVTRELAILVVPKAAVPAPVVDLYMAPCHAAATAHGRDVFAVGYDHDAILGFAILAKDGKLKPAPVPGAN